MIEGQPSKEKNLEIITIPNKNAKRKGRAKG